MSLSSAAATAAQWRQPGWPAAVARSRDSRSRSACWNGAGNTCRAPSPSRLAELPGHLRFSTPGGQVRGQREGLFDLRLAGDANVLLANGLGGGSLINAGVLEEPAAEVVAALEQAAPGLATHFASARARLIAVDGGTLQAHGIAAPAKLMALEQLGRQVKGGKLRQARISVALEARDSSAQVRLDRCVQCGDCVTGCNFNAKESLDTNLLVDAWRHGAELYTGATVLRFEHDRAAGCWLLHLTYTDPACANGSRSRWC